MIQYMSTRGSKETKSAAQAIIQGIAKDKGLYVPNQLPAFNKPISQLIGKNYQSIAYEVMSQYLSDFTEDELKDAVNKAYDEKFEKDEIVPIVNRGGAHFLELYHGKTAAFKDMALSILPHLLTKSLKKEKEDKKIPFESLLAIFNDFDLLWKEATMDEKKQILNILINKIIVTDLVNIEWNM